VIPWIILAVVAVPVLVIGFAATRKRTAAAEHRVGVTAQRRAETEGEFAEAAAYEAEWRDEDKRRFHEERLP